jgi:hypothetical protein
LNATISRCTSCTFSLEIAPFLLMNYAERAI